MHDMQHDIDFTLQHIAISVAAPHTFSYISLVFKYINVYLGAKGDRANANFAYRLQESWDMNQLVKLVCAHKRLSIY